MLGAIFSALVAVNSYFVTAAQFQETRKALVSNAAARFPTPSQAAYAASLEYKAPLITGEIGAKIFADVDSSGNESYSFGPRIYSEVDPQDNADEIVYDTTARDGHARVVGLWHEHALGSTFVDLYGHYDVIRETHQTVWTTIGYAFYVQYFDGDTVQPIWTASVPAIAPLCSACD